MKGARFKVYQDDAKQWRWRLQSANGRILADSGEGYSRKRDAERAVQTVVQTTFDLWRTISKQAEKWRNGPFPITIGEAKPFPGTIIRIN